MHLHSCSRNQREEEFTWVLGRSHTFPLLPPRKGMAPSRPPPASSPKHAVSSAVCEPPSLESLARPTRETLSLPPRLTRRICRPIWPSPPPLDHAFCHPSTSHPRARPDPCRLNPWTERESERHEREKMHREEKGALLMEEFAGAKSTSAPSLWALLTPHPLQ
jgi:hypothetical protein